MNYSENVIEQDTYKINLNNGEMFYYKINNNSSLSSIIIKKVKEVSDSDIIKYNVESSQVGVLIENYNDIKKIIDALKQSLMDNYLTDIKNMKIIINVTDVNEKEQVESVLSSENIPHVVNMKDDNVKDEASKISEKLEEEVKASGESDIIKVEDNNISKEYVVYGDDVFDNNINDLKSEKKSLLENMLKDPEVSKLISRLSSEELDKLLMERIIQNKKRYRLEKSDVASKKGKNVSDVAGHIAYRNDGLYNSELGIVKNGVTSNDKYTSVERDDGNIRVVTPEITSMDVSNTTNSYEESMGIDKFVIDKDKNRQIIDDKNYYYDDDGNVYDENSNFVGKIGSNGYTFNYENNSLLKDNQMLGYLDHIRNVKSENISEKSAYTKRLVKPEEKQNNNSQGNISIYGIVGIILVLIIIVIIHCI